MGVPHHAKLIYALKDLRHFAFLGIFWKNIFIDRPPRRSMHAQKRSHGHAHSQLSQKFPSLDGLIPVTLRLCLKLLTRPKRGVLGGLIKISWFVHHGVIVIAHQAPLATLGHQVHASHRIGSVTNNVAKRNNSIHTFGVDIRQHCLQCLQVSMYVANDAYSHAVSKGHQCYGFAAHASKTHFIYCVFAGN